jgi:hypothetical protein
LAIVAPFATRTVSVTITVLTALALAMAAGGCDGPAHAVPDLRKDRSALPYTLETGRFWPDAGEVEAVGRLEKRVERGTPAFERLVSADTSDIVFKDEEGTGADRLMTRELRGRLHRLAELVRRQWPSAQLRVTEAWDEDAEHGSQSLHYEGRAADLTTADLDPDKLGRLAGLAVEAGFDWVYREATHIHVSVRRR